jgi:hypothetical protein
MEIEMVDWTTLMEILLQTSMKKMDYAAIILLLSFKALTEKYGLVAEREIFGDMTEKN